LSTSAPFTADDPAKSIDPEPAQPLRQRATGRVATRRLLPAFFGGEAVLMMELPRRHSTPPPPEGGRFAPILASSESLYGGQSFHGGESFRKRKRKRRTRRGTMGKIRGGMWRRVMMKRMRLQELEETDSSHSGSQKNHNVLGSNSHTGGRCRGRRTCKEMYNLPWDRGPPARSAAIGDGVARCFQMFLSLIGLLAFLFELPVWRCRRHRLVRHEHVACIRPEAVSGPIMV
jgi:hypothetical protein